MKKTLLFIFLSVLGGMSFSTLGKNVESPLSQMFTTWTGETSKNWVVEIIRPWARAADVQTNTAVFMTLHPLIPEGDILLQAECPVAEKVEIHTQIQENGISRMKPLDQLVVTSNQVLKPGGLHLMLINLSEPLKEGGEFLMVLVFKNSGHIPCKVKVEKKGACHCTDSDQAV